MDTTFLYQPANWHVGRCATTLALLLLTSALLACDDAGVSTHTKTGTSESVQVALEQNNTSETGVPMGAGVQVQEESAHTPKQ